jgi:hypothetical protein
MAIESLHGRCEQRLKNNAELACTGNHDNVNKIPFKLEMLNLGTTLTEWADEMKLDIPWEGGADGIHHIGTGCSKYVLYIGTEKYDAGDMVNNVGSDQTCTVCGMKGP